VLLIATSLRDVYQTLNRLLVVELLVTLAVLGAIGGLGLWVVRLGLRPLRAIEATAATIAAGYRPLLHPSAPAGHGLRVLEATRG
jgi:two-component system OmpR family sensor kinase